MPICLPPIDRRSFLAGSLAAGVNALLPRRLWADDWPLDPDYFVVLADIHISNQQDIEHRGSKPVPMFRKAVERILDLGTRPAAAIVAGDCAFREGLPGDYAMLGRLLRPLRAAGVPVHLALGNHDHRLQLLSAFPDSTPRPAVRPTIPHKHVSVLKTTHADWYLLDSLDKTNVNPGVLGEAQLAWLAKSLDAQPNRPAIALAHHNLDWMVRAHGVADTAAFLNVVKTRPQVKAYFFGHTHAWRVNERMGLQLVNVPAVAWLFDPAQPRGFVTVKLRPDGATVVLEALDRNHPKHGKTVNLNWRA
jgi:3',5'-cyclic-AMP phosphodiesterase